MHEPDFADEMRRYSADFQLSGHSHGGQVCFPIVGALYLLELAKSIHWDIPGLATSSYTRIAE